MKMKFNNTPLAILVLLIGIAIIVAGILIMALYHDMSWLSYLLISIIMLCAIWGIFNIPFTVYLRDNDGERKRRH